MEEDLGCGRPSAIQPDILSKEASWNVGMHFYFAPWSQVLLSLLQASSLKVPQLTIPTTVLVTHPDIVGIDGIYIVKVISNPPAKPRAAVWICPAFVKSSFMQAS